MFPLKHIFVTLKKSSVYFFVTGCMHLGDRKCLRLVTLAVLQHGLHGALPVRVPADAGRTGHLTVLGPPALPQVHLMEVIHHEQS